MARSASIRIPIAFEAGEKSAVIIRLKKLPEREFELAGSEFDVEHGFGISGWPGHAHLYHQVVKAYKIIKSRE